MTKREVNRTRRTGKKTIGLIRLCVNICLEPLDAEVVLRVWVCLLLEHQRGGQDGRGLMYVCAGREGERASGE